MSRSPPSAQSWRHDTTEGHSPLEIEHRFTVLETVVSDHSEQHDGHRETQSKHDRRLSLVEKAILVLAMSVYIMAQDRFPVIADLIKGVIP